MDNPNLGLVFSGGGGKGSYEIGVWRALEEFNIPPRVAAVAGTSVGALNAALFAQGDLSLAERLWRNMATSDILHMTPERAVKVAADILLSLKMPTTAVAQLAHVLRSRGFFSREGLLRLMEKNLDTARLANSHLPVFATTRRKGSISIRHFSLEGADKARIYAVLLASSAIPVIFPPEQIDGQEWLDGGFPSFSGVGCNTPIQPVYKTGCRTIIAVLLDMDDLIDVTAFPDATVLFVYPQVSNGRYLNGAFDFDGAHADRRMDQGYADAMRILEPIYRTGVAHARYGAALEVAQAQQQEFAAVREQMTAIRAESADARRAALAAIADLGSM